MEHGRRQQRVEDTMWRRTFQHQRPIHCTQTHTHILTHTAPTPLHPRCTSSTSLTHRWPHSPSVLHNIVSPDTTTLVVVWTCAAQPIGVHLQTCGPLLSWRLRTFYGRSPRLVQDVCLVNRQDKSYRQRGKRHHLRLCPCA